MRKQEKKNKPYLLCFFMIWEMFDRREKNL
jgi:hypothetical protein